MATPKQVKESIRKIRLYTHKLQQALNEAHNKEIISYDGPYQDCAPCASLEEVRKRVRVTTKEAVYKAFIDEIKQDEW